jgi:dienelactone hydrolase
MAIGRLLKWFGIALAGLVILVLVGLLWVFWPEGPNLAEPLAGAYRTPEDELLILVVNGQDTVRVMSPESGLTRTLYLTDIDRFESGDGWRSREPVTLRGEVVRGSGGNVSALKWTPEGGEEIEIERLPFVEREVYFSSGELSLRGLLVLPQESDGPVPTLVAVHGSGREQAVYGYRLPYLAAAHGMAGFVFDKRGTGESEGDYTQNFPDLAGDVKAAVDFLRTQPEVDADRIGLVGFSQGGWIAPMAAAQGAPVNAIVVNYGVALPVFDEDRWGYVWALQHEGFGESEIAEVDAINEIMAQVIDERRKDVYGELGEAIEKAKGRPWYPVLEKSDSSVGYLVGSPFPLWAWEWFDKLVGFEVIYGSIDRLYDPESTIRGLEIPSLWLFAGDDSSAPTPWSVEVLEGLRAEGAPIEIEVFPGIEHGMILVEDSADGEREYLSYRPGYPLRYIRWLQQQNGLLQSGDALDTSPTWNR